MGLFASLAGGAFVGLVWVFFSAIQIGNGNLDWGYVPFCAFCGLLGSLVIFCRFRLSITK